MALAIDGHVNGNNSGASSVTSAALTTSNAGDIIIVYAAMEGASPTAAPTCSGGGLTFALRSRVTYSAVAPFAAPVDVVMFWAYASAVVSAQAFTVTWGSTSGTPDDLNNVAFGVSGFLGTLYQTNPFDPNGSLPATADATGVTTSSPSISGISTTNANCMLLNCVGAVDYQYTPNEPTSAPTGFTYLDGFFNGGGSNVCDLFGAYKVVSATQSSITETWSLTGNNWGIIADALYQGTGGTTVNLTGALGGVALKSMIGFTGKTSMAGRSTAQAKTRDTLSATTAFQAVTGRGFSMVRSRGAPIFKAVMAGRSLDMTTAQPNMSATAAIAGRATSDAMAKAKASAGAALAAKATTQTKSQNTIAGKIGLAARAATMTFTRIVAPGAIALLARAATMMSSKMAFSGRTGLAGHSTAQVKSPAGITAGSSLQAIAGLGKAMVTARGGMAAKVGLAARTATMFTARMVPPGAVALLAHAVAMVTGRFGGFSGAATLTARSTAQAKSATGISGSLKLASRATTAFAAHGAVSAFAFLASRAQATAKASGVTRLGVALTASAKVAAKASARFAKAFLSGSSQISTKAAGGITAVFFNLTPVAARTIIVKRIHTLFAKW